jgi:hypothetical protein
LDIAKEILLALIAKVRPGARIETMLADVVLAFGVITRTLREVEEQEYAQLRSLAPQVPDRRPRAKPYRVEGAEALPRPRIPGARALKYPEGNGLGSGPVLLERSKNGRRAR